MILTTKKSAAVIMRSDLRVLVTTKGDVVYTEMTDAQLIAALKRAMTIKRSEFGESLLQQHAEGRTLSAKQLPWVAKLAAERLDSTDSSGYTRPALPKIPGVERLFAMFDSAKASGLQYPKILATVAGLDVKLSIASDRATYPGTMNVVVGSNHWLGRVARDGSADIYKARCAEVGVETESVVYALEEFSANPVEVVRRWGQRRGSCALCGRTLTDPRSIAANVGPVCSAKWGLPYPASLPVASDAADVDLDVPFS